MKRPELNDFTTGGSMIAPHGGYDYEAYSNALNKYIDTLGKTPEEIMKHILELEKDIKTERKSALEEPLTERSMKKIKEAMEFTDKFRAVIQSLQWVMSK